MSAIFTKAMLYKVYIISTYLAMVGLIVFTVMKIKIVLNSRKQEGNITEIKQNNNLEILKTEKFKLAKPLTVHYITISSLTGFLLVFGFMGTQTLNNNIRSWPSLIISMLLGVTGLVIFALIDYAIDLLTRFDIVFSANTVGLKAIVYKDIKAKKGGIGKVRLTYNGMIVEFDAVTNNEVTLRKNADVKIVNSISDTCVVVDSILY